MAAYMVFIRESTTDQSELDTYSEKVRDTIVGHSLKILAVSTGRHEIVEGQEAEGVVILEFPTFEEAKAWYESPAYCEVREHRFRGADYRTLIVQGM